VNQDLKLERESFQSSKTCLDQMYMELQKKVIDETKLRNVNILLFKKKAIIISLKSQN
jgi:hypothetical protein